MSGKIKYIILLGILFVAACMRLIKLGVIPEGVTNDEAGAIFNAYSIAKTGQSLDGRQYPLSFTLDSSSSPVFIYLAAPFTAIFGPSGFSLRLPFALISVATIGLLYFLTKQLFDNTAIALFSSFVLAVSPWHIHMNRGAYDGPITFFFLATLIVLAYGFSARKGNILYSLPLLAISFYSYHATKIFWIVFIPFLFLMQRRKLLQNSRQSILFIIGFAAIVCSFWFVLVRQGVTRQQVIAFPDLPKLTRQVNWERSVNNAPQILRVLYSNKATIYIKGIIGKYLEAFSPQFLFVSGEGGIYGTWNHGVLYLLDLPLLIFGFVYLFRTKKILARNLIIGSVLIVPLCSSITVDVSWSLRGIFLLPLFAIVIGCGAYQFIKWTKHLKPIVARLTVILLILLYVWSIGGYIYLYFFRYSIYGAEYWFASSKDISIVIGSIRQQYQRVWVAGAGDMYIFQYGLYNHSSLQQVQKAWNGRWPKQIDNVFFLEQCIKTGNKPFNPVRDLPQNTLYVTRESCHPEAIPDITIRDRGEPLRILWKVYKHID
jgi:4-amino-4-deoxy-L-arabinose transferase-like glycosyltransferase